MINTILEKSACDPLKYIMDNLILIVAICKRKKSIRIQKSSPNQGKLELSENLTIAPLQPRSKFGPVVQKEMLFKERLTDARTDIQTTDDGQKVIAIAYVEPSAQVICLFVFVALRPMSTAMVIAGRSVHLTTLFPGQA